MGETHHHRCPSCEERWECEEKDCDAGSEVMCEACAEEEQSEPDEEDE